MTAQINDRVFHSKLDYSLAGVSGSGLFSPEEHLSFEPAAVCTACWRGDVADYKVADEKLYLDKLEVGLPEELAIKSRAGKGPEIFGKKSSGVSKYMNLHQFEDLGYLMPFTGGLLLADGFIRELYVHMGFHSAWKYQTVVELLFENGELLECSDRSERMATVREQMLIDGELSQWNSDDEEKVKELIEESFSLNY